VLGPRETLLDSGPLIRGEVLLELRAGQGKNRVPRHANFEQLVDEHLIAADGNGRQADPFTGDLAAQCFQAGPERRGHPGLIGDLTVAGKPDDVKQWQLAGM
jgi:hypothetical protein